MLDVMKRVWLILGISIVFVINLAGGAQVRASDINLNVKNPATIRTNVVISVDSAGLGRAKDELEDCNRRMLQECYERCEQRFDSAEGKLTCAYAWTYAEFKSLIKEILEESRSRITTVLALFAIVATVLSIAAGFWGVYLPVKNDSERTNGWADLRDKVKKQNNKIEAKLRWHESEAKKIRGLVHFLAAQSEAAEGRDANRSDANRIRSYGNAIRELTKAMLNDMQGNDIKSLCASIRFLHSVIGQLQPLDNTANAKSIDSYIKGWRWPIKIKDIQDFIRNNPRFLPSDGYAYDDEIEDLYNKYWK